MCKMNIKKLKHNELKKDSDIKFSQLERSFYEKKHFQKIVAKTYKYLVESVPLVIKKSEIGYYSLN